MATDLSVSVLTSTGPVVELTVTMPIMYILTRDDRSTSVSHPTTGASLGISSSATMPQFGQ